MCGIFTISINKITQEQKRDLPSIIKDLIKSSAKRGRDALGLVVVIDNEARDYKSPNDPLDEIKSLDFNNFINSITEGADIGSSLVVMGQCRLATSCTSINLENNQPIITDTYIGLHNGILTQFLDQDHFTSTKQMEKKLQFSDSRLLFDALNKEQGDIFNKVKGETSFVFLDRKTNKLLYGTNTGSLYYNNEDFLIIASEKRLTKEYNLNKVELRKVQENLQMNSFVYLKSDWRKSLKRCTKCLLPESHPFIDFDKNGVCNYCRNYKVQKYIGRDKLLRKLDSIRSTNGEVDCIVGLSGGRDSCYGLHVLKKDFGMNPIAYTYDWGLTTQASRRNQSIICSELGVEHIIRSANLERKRKYINQNIKAWLKKPKLGMIPLFMAGDKEFYEYGRNLRKELGVETTILCSGQQIEQREFMVGFTGIKQPTLHNNPDMYHHPTIVKIKLATWYGLQYILNPSYFNSSFIDSLRAYFISFFKQSSEFIFLYRYLPWDETKINNTLKSYGWENDEAYGDNQWRMGDGQTAFNNFIYYHLAGLTEFDSYRSHQIRQGLISRDEALKKLKDENEPRLESIKEFFDVVGLPFEETLKKIKRIKPISF